MKYIDYINLGFTREDIHDTVEFNDTGYHGYYLFKELSPNVSIQVSYPDLDNANLYIPMGLVDNFYIVPISDEIIRGLLKKK